MSIRVTPSYEMSGERAARLETLNREAQRIRSAHDHDQYRHVQAWERAVQAEFALRPEHIALLQRMKFELHEGTDLVSIGASGKRPFGNSDWVEDIFDILGWPPTYDRDGIDEASEAKARRIMAELPLALNAIIAGLRVESAPVAAGEQG